MKKLLIGVASGALLLSMAGVVLASSHHGSSVVQFSDVSSVTTSSSVSGQNGQTGGGKQFTFTGNSDSSSVSLTGGNVNVGDGSGKVFQGTEVGSVTTASSVSGQNGQTGGSSHHHSSSTQVLGTGDSSSFAGSATVGNVNVSL